MKLDEINRTIREDDLFLPFDLQQSLLRLFEYVQVLQEEYMIVEAALDGEFGTEDEMGQEIIDFGTRDEF